MNSQDLKAAIEKITQRGGLSNVGRYVITFKAFYLTTMVLFLHDHLLIFHIGGGNNNPSRNESHYICIIYSGGKNHRHTHAGEFQHAWFFGVTTFFRISRATIVTVSSLVFNHLLFNIKLPNQFHLGSPTAPLGNLALISCCYGDDYTKRCMSFALNWVSCDVWASGQQGHQKSKV